MFSVGDTVKVISDPHTGTIRFVGYIGKITAIDGDWHEVGNVRWSGWFRAGDLELVNATD